MKKCSVLLFAVVVALVSLSAPASTILMGPDSNNGSFEAVPVVPDGGSGTLFYQFTNPAGWNFAPMSEGAIMAMQTAGTTGDGAVTILAPQGGQFTTMCGLGWLYQSGTCGNFEANTVYTLTGYAARYGASTPELYLASGGLGVGYALPATPADYVFAAFPTITIDTSVNGSLVGLPIEIVCRSLQGAASTQALFDNIVLTATQVPEPASMILLALGGLFLRKK